MLVDPSTIGPARDATSGGWGAAAGANDAHWTRALARRCGRRRGGQYHHSGLCGGAALRADARGGSRPELAALKRLDDRVDWWHDVALAAFSSSAPDARPWDGQRKRASRRFGPTAFERLGKDGRTPPLAAEDARLYRRVDPETHRGYAPDADAVYDLERAAERRTRRTPSTRSPENAASTPVRESAEEALPWDATAIREVDEDDPSFARWSGKVSDVDALAAALGAEPFRVDRRIRIGRRAGRARCRARRDARARGRRTVVGRVQSRTTADPTADPTASGSEVLSRRVGSLVKWRGCAFGSGD